MITNYKFIELNPPESRSSNNFVDEMNFALLVLVMKTPKDFDLISKYYFKRRLFASVFTFRLEKTNGLCFLVRLILQDQDGRIYCESSDERIVSIFDIF